MIPCVSQTGGDDGRPPKKWEFWVAIGLVVLGILAAVFFTLR